MPVGFLNKICSRKIPLCQTGDTVQNTVFKKMAVFGIRVDKGEFNIRAHLDALGNNVQRDPYIHTGKYILFYNNKKLSRGYIDSMLTDHVNVIGLDDGLFYIKPYEEMLTYPDHLTTETTTILCEMANLKFHKHINIIGHKLNPYGADEFAMGFQNNNVCHLLNYTAFWPNTHRKLTL